MANKESAVQKWVRDRIALEFGHSAVYLKYPAGQYSSRGVSDLVYCIHSLYVAIEVKTETGKLTALQARFSNQVIEAGGLAYVIYGKDESKLKEIIHDVHARRNSRTKNFEEQGYLQKD